MVRYLLHGQICKFPNLNIIFMNINENFKTLENCKKLTLDYLISARKHHWFTLYVVVPQMVQFDKFVHLVAIDVNYLICIFMNIYENFKNDRKIIGKKKVSNAKELEPC